MVKHFSLTVGNIKYPKNKGKTISSPNLQEMNPFTAGTTYQPEFEALEELRTSTRFQNVLSLNRLFKPHT